MKTVQNSQSIGRVKLPQPSPRSQAESQSNQAKPAATVDSNLASTSGSDSRKVLPEDIELVQNLIERCLQLYMNRGEVVKTLLNRAKIDPAFTTLVWQKLEEENPDFFRAYYIRLKLKKQINQFNLLLEHHFQLMKYPPQPTIPMAPVQNGIHHMPVNNLPMGYPIMQQHPMAVHGQPHLSSMNRGLPGCHQVVSGVPAPGNFQPIRINSANISTKDNAAEVAVSHPPGSGVSPVSEMVTSPASVASSGHFPFTPEMSGIGMDSSMIDTSFPSEVGNPEDLQLGEDVGPGSSRDSLLSLGQIHWDINLSDLTVDLSNLEDLGDLGNYTSSPFLPSDSELLLESPEQNDLVDEYFAEAIAGSSTQVDEDNS